MIYSTNDIWRGDEEDRCLTDDLDAIEGDIADLEAGKAEADHTHTGYAAAAHEHAGYASSDHSHSDYAASGHSHSEYAAASHEHEGYAASSHEHAGYADAEHTHSGYAASGHTHEQSSIPGLIAALAAKAEATHDHTLAQVVGLVAALAAKADLVDGKVPASQLPGFVDNVQEYANLAAFPATGESGKIYVAQDTNKTYRWSGSGYIEISASLALGETSATAYRGDRGKIAYDHSQSSDVHVTAAQKTAWDGKAAGDHTHTPAAIGAAAASHTHDYAAGNHTHTLASIGAAAASHTHDYAASGHTHTPAAIGAAPASHAHSGYAAADHTHDYAASNHKHTEHSGDITINKVSGPGINLQATGLGIKTRIHKNASTTADYGTIISDYAADGKRDYLTIRRSSPSMGNKLLLNMEDASGGATKTYQIYGEHNKPGVLWSGNLYMNSGHTVTPSKPLSECRTGWMLLWSDYDPDTATANDAEFFTTMIPRITPTGAAWAGKSFNCDIPRHIGGDQADVSTEKRIIKMVYIYDDKITGHAANNQDTRTDVVLRAVYEF